MIEKYVYFARITESGCIKNAVKFHKPKVLLYCFLMNVEEQ